MDICFCILVLILAYSLKRIASNLGGIFENVFNSVEVYFPSELPCNKYPNLHNKINICVLKLTILRQLCI